MKRLITLSSLIFSMLFLPSLGMCRTPENQIQLRLEPGYDLIIAERKQIIPVRIGLVGFTKKEQADRTPVNISIVLDRSGSMSGNKLHQAKEAAIMALELLRSDDIVSVITYESGVEVIVPSTRLRDRSSVISAIRNIRSGGSTALFAGVSRGASELRKFLEANQVNRVVLLSDGLANVGPQSPGDLGELGKSLAREGITVSTFGLGTGYNEELMTRLANASDGNHAFVETPQDLARIFRIEFGDIVNVVAKDIEIEIHCKEGFRPIRVLGQDAQIYGQKVITKLGQIYSKEERSIILEVEAPARSAGSSAQIAEVRVVYQNIDEQRQDRLKETLSLSFTTSESKMRKSVNKAALGDFLKQQANVASNRAIELRDAGKLNAAKDTLSRTSQMLNSNAKMYDMDELRVEGAIYDKQAVQIGESDWNSNRKQMKSSNFAVQKGRKVEKFQNSNSISK